LQFVADLFILMNAIRWLVVAIVAEPNLETEPFRLGSERATKYMMPFKPSPGVAYKALGAVLL
jgi:hypothetical protein